MFVAAVMISNMFRLLSVGTKLFSNSKSKATKSVTQDRAEIKCKLTCTY